MHLQRYGLAVLSVGVALAAALLLQHFHFRDAAVPLLLFAVAITSWYGGPGPAVLAVVLSLMGFAYFFVPPIYSLRVAPSELPYFIIFASFASLVTWFATIRRRVDEDLRQTRDRLRVEVEERSEPARPDARLHLRPESQGDHHLLESRRGRILRMDTGGSDWQATWRTPAHRFPKAVRGNLAGVAADGSMGGRTHAHQGGRHPGDRGEPVVPAA